MSERLFDVKAEATDKFSTDLKDTYRQNLENLMIAKPIMEEAKQCRVLHSRCRYEERHKSKGSTP